MALSDRILTREVLGNRVGRSKVLGLKTTSEEFMINKSEIKDLQQIHGAIALRELRAEQRKGNLTNINTFVDGSQFKQVRDVKFAGNISFQDVVDIADLMLFIQATQHKITPKLTGALKASFVWLLNGKPLPISSVPNLKPTDRLLYVSTVPYAKYVEIGIRKSTKTLKNRFFVRKTARRAQQKYGRAFIVKPVLAQASEVPPQFSSRSSKGAYSKQYYIERWKVSYPAIQVTQRSGVRFTPR